jgi:hypothetical protein
MTEGEVEKVYKVYHRRWFVLIAVLLVTLANNILWISYASVNSYASVYYGKEPSQIDLFTTISFLIGIPVCLASTWIVDRMGLG